MKGRKIKYETKTLKRKARANNRREEKRKQRIKNHATVKEEKEERKRERETYLQWRNCRGATQGNLEEKESPKKILGESLKNWSVFAI